MGEVELLSNKCVLMRFFMVYEKDHYDLYYSEDHPNSYLLKELKKKTDDQVLFGEETRFILTPRNISYLNEIVKSSVFSKIIEKHFSSFYEKEINVKSIELNFEVESIAGNMHFLYVLIDFEEDFLNIDFALINEKIKSEHGVKRREASFSIRFYLSSYQKDNFYVESDICKKESFSLKDIEYLKNLKKNQSNINYQDDFLKINIRKFFNMKELNCG